MDKDKLVATANALVAPGKGILAADESTGTIKNRFDVIGVENTEEARQTYRNMLFTSSGIENHISGVIMFDETARQSTADGVPFPAYLKSLGIEPGIKVDQGAQDMEGHPGEKVTTGLAGLRERLEEYAAMGLTFAKWRAVITINDGLPSGGCIADNADALADYGALCQAAGLVPIIEPEVLMDGSHTIDRCAEVSDRTLEMVFESLAASRVYLPGIVLKPNMVVSGSACSQQADVATVAARTVEMLKRRVPEHVPGIAFLSGGQTELSATSHLQAINALQAEKPWALTFSYGRALQKGALKSWSGNEAQLADGQKAFMHRAKMNAAAAAGKYSEALEAA
ncbi:MAG: fructose-bisphosphate aldolase class I [Candidatus Marinimicrobia bacterium]|nr:fructose-bisphosphate aldolase class I [Candidatus Neomarinimicrobiota bacterium]